MRALHSTVLTLAVLACTACTPLMRGFQQGELVSQNAPPVTIQSSLPLLTKGQSAPFVQVDMTFANPQTWLAVYGGQTPSAPVAVAVYSVAPTNLQWDLAGIELVDSPVVNEVAFGGHTFSSIFRVISGQRDPFTPLTAADADSADKMVWLSQRFVSLEDFRKTKIILEYRELMPESLADMAGTPGLLLLRPETQAFAQRAQAAFTVQFAYTGPAIARAPYLGDTVNQRYLGAFLGGLSPIAPFFSDEL